MIRFNGKWLNKHTGEKIQIRHQDSDSYLIDYDPDNSDSKLKDVFILIGNEKEAIIRFIEGEPDIHIQIYDDDSFEMNGSTYQRIIH